MACGTRYGEYAWCEPGSECAGCLAVAPAKARPGERLPYDVTTARYGKPCGCGETMEALDPEHGLFVCIRCGTPACAEDQPNHEEQTKIRAQYRESVAALAAVPAHFVIKKDAPLEEAAQRIARAWIDYLTTESAIEIARTVVTPLAWPQQSLSIFELAKSVFEHRRKHYGLVLADAMIARLATLASDAYKAA